MEPKHRSQVPPLLVSDDRRYSPENMLLMNIFKFFVDAHAGMEKALALTRVVPSTSL